MENQENNNSQLKNIARWIAVAPVAVAGIFVGTIAMNIFFFIQRWFLGANSEGDRKSVVEGKSVDLGGRRIIKKTTP